MNIPLVDLKLQYASMREEIDEAVRRVIERGAFILGPQVEALESEMAAYLGVKYGIGVASGTDALQLALLACDIGPGDEVITTPFTFIATAESIAKCGANPVFVDIDPQTYNIDPTRIGAKITEKTRAVLPVHLYGQSVDMEPVLELARKHDLTVIEDCAQALGAEYKGRRVGGLADAGCFSFFPSKNLGAYGDGGMVVTNDTRVAQTVRMLRVHGSRETYHHVIHGFNSRLDALQAAVLRVKLNHLDHWNECRRSRAALYAGLLMQVDGIEPLHIEEHCRSSHNYYTVRVDGSRIDRGALREHLGSKGIATAVYYPLSLHLQEVYRYLGHKPGDFPRSEQAQEEVLSLPIYPELTEDQIEQIAGEINRFVER